ncbi:3-hydroxyacyl-ACP dehydratase FabZ [Niallia sp. NCCP-28]|uniref:3-hydroxyacyl-ACP dehydratase FabZ n=1 Tax=Niallia sp. NCCP-28 TaxID=2934712 RepID=UPI002087C072|nr:3-hydroxyacyl-ACP dehydratase FabZ [Niallia sp. NCCP-28]GKU83156.1 3-hydroxyacyl-[acyl-carrier-protein] dehydratase FabZ [Niallia sp. NCCP-28]
MMNLPKVKEILSRYPLPLVDEILELKEGKMAVGVKQISKEDTFAFGQNPNSPLMPGVLIVEAIAQVTAVAIHSDEKHDNKQALLARIHNCRIRKQVFPGDELCVEVFVTKVKKTIAKAAGRATVRGELIGEAEFLFSFK